MKIGLFGINMFPCTDPEVAIRIAQTAESAGFDSLWTGEHVVLPDPQAPPSPVPPETPFLDPAVALTFVAAHTKTVRVATGIIILPQRNPLVLAKELASVDVLSGGRLIFGLGIGYLKAEFDALGIPFDDKGARAMEYLDAMLAVWTEAAPRYSGRFVSFSGIQSQPQPAQKPRPPIVIGGVSPQGYRRAVTRGNGWYGYALDVDATAGCIAALREAEKRYGRPPELGPLEITVTPRGRPDLDTARRFRDLGVHRLVVFRPRVGEQEVLDLVRGLGEKVVPHL